MSTNKNAILRYKTLDKCFSNFHRKYFFNDLLDAVNHALWDYNPDLEGVKVRQLREDIRFMRSMEGYNAPIETIKEGSKPYYRYEDKEFRIHKKPLTENEAELMQRAVSIIQRFEGAPQFEWFKELAPMLNSELGLNSGQQKIMSLESNIDYSGYDNILPMFNAIENKRVLKVKYQPFKKKEEELIFHPYHLKQYNNRWFALGLNTINDIPTWNLALDRINNIKEINGKYINSEIDWEDYFYDVIGVTIPKDVLKTKVILKISNSLWPYINTKPLHPSQKTKEVTDAFAIIELNIIPNMEFESRILSYAENMELLEPNWLRTRFTERIKSTLKQYQ